MIIDYRVNAKFRPSKREVWLMSRKAEEAGFNVDTKMMKAMDCGDVKFHEGAFYKLCRHCMAYLPTEDFYANKRYVLEVGYVCKECVATRRRIKNYGVATFITDVGMKETPSGVVFNVKEETANIIKARVGDSIGFTQEEDC